MANVKNSNQNIESIKNNSTYFLNCLPSRYYDNKIESNGHLIFDSDDKYIYEKPLIKQLIQSNGIL